MLIHDTFCRDASVQ